MAGECRPVQRLLSELVRLCCKGCVMRELVLHRLRVAGKHGASHCARGVHWRHDDSCVRTRLLRW